MRDKYAFVPGAAPPANNPANIRLGAVCTLVQNYFTNAKVTRKAAAATAANQLQIALNAPHPNIVNAFRTYEAAHLAIGDMSANQLEIALRNYVQQAYLLQFPLGWGAPQPPPGQSRVDLRFTNGGGGSTDVQVLVREPANANPTYWIVGRVYAGTARFEILPLGQQPANRQNDLYIRRGFPGQHYISYVRGGATRYVRRYVIRGLNQEDSTRITAGNGLVAPEQNPNATANELAEPTHTGKHGGGLNVGDVLTDEQQILSHTRGWKKRFISATTTFRPAYSTRGQEFRSVFGKVIIDLAFVPGGDIFDLHTPGALAALNTDANQIQVAPYQANPGARTQADEEVLAGRDVVRTREVLIHWQVPFAAIRTLGIGQNVIAIWHAGGAPNGSATFGAVDAAWTPGHPWDNDETLDYRWNFNWYKFYHFANAAAANNAWAAIPNPFHGNRQRLTEYDFPNPLPLGFTR